MSTEVTLLEEETIALSRSRWVSPPHTTPCRGPNSRAFPVKQQPGYGSVAIPVVDLSASAVSNDDGV